MTDTWIKIARVWYQTPQYKTTTSAKNRNGEIKQNFNYIRVLMVTCIRTDSMMILTDRQDFHHSAEKF